MFAPLTAPSASASGAFGRSDMYRQIGVQTGVSEASAHHLIAMLFDGALEAIAQARGAMASGQIELKARAIGKAVRIVDEGLKAAINPVEGGPLASQLSELYGYIALRLSESNARNDEQGLVECARLLQPLKEAWSGIAAQVNTPARR